MAGNSMSMSQQQRLQMVLAPQLRQSLEMLQVPVFELRAMIQEELEVNPAIEDVEGNDVSVEAEKPEQKEEDPGELDFEKEFEALEQLDADWRDYFYQNLQNAPYNRDQEEKRQYMLDSIQQTESLQEHLLAQLRLTAMSPHDQQLAEMIIGNIDDDGYLAMDLEALAETMGGDHEHLQEILRTVQAFHPTGIGAEDLRECLLLQLSRLGHEDELVARVVDRHMDLLARHKYKAIAHKEKVDVKDVQAAIEMITSLDPRPGRMFTAEAAGYILPEVIVKKVDGEYVVMVDNDQLPHVRISAQYRKLLRNPKTPDEVKTYVREKIRSGAFLVKSIHQRQKTIHRIASEIVRTQSEFLDKGLSHLRPLTMAEVAERVDVHETTVSRTVANKYMKTPSGVFEMKYFFTPGLKTSSGSDMSNKAVKEIIDNMVANEDPLKPLSDQAIQDALKEKGIKIARRTVAKYRLMLKIPPSHMRRRY